ncbi:cyanophycinase [Candidatus Planktophila vernalis]|uniref:Cyanophycinase n=1 Tax=Candidatus Planktophila vernalis TaxID=1884907 RepID=A0A249KSW6_9ACTN|nr:Type 1 glutamine amidotransferase-like domain-containing protein [Candidatus Planktophila vernalis]ASY19864.1 cyanophycinase [Candidatus Planktophila vernalis]
MNGSLALVGSGEYLPAMAEFEKSLVHDGVKNGKEARYVQIPTAAGRESTDRLEYWKQLGLTQAKAIGVEATYLPIYTREDAFNQKYVDAVANSALMYMSGGDPHHLAEVLSDTPLWSAIVENWKTGASLAGCSAGAMVLSAHIPNFRLLKKTATQGLNLLPEIRVIPHFNKFFKWIPESAAKVLLHVPDNSILIGVDELTAIVKRSGDTEWVVVGEAKVHVLKGLPDQQLHDGERIKLPTP